MSEQKARSILSMAASSARLRPAAGLGASPAECGALVRKGWLQSLQQSEQVRGERREYYKLYRITDAGREALFMMEKGA